MQSDTAVPSAIDPRPGRPRAPLERIAFLHLPKTGGTSLTQALQRDWPRLRIIAGNPDLDTIGAEEAQAYDMVAGHFYAFQLERPALAGFAPITVLRDPITRLLSSYHFMRLSASLGAPPDPVMNYAEHAPFFEYALNVASDRHGQLFVLGLDAVPGVEFVRMQDLLDRALRRLERMRVGVMDMLEPFLGSLLREAGIDEAPVLEHLLVAETPHEDGMTGPQRAALRELLAPDYALYERARALAMARLDGQVGPTEGRALVAARPRVPALPVLPTLGAAASAVVPAHPVPPVAAVPARPVPPVAVPPTIPPPPASGAACQGKPAVTDLIPRLKAMTGPIRTLQKVCDAADWADPRLLAVIREGFGLPPRINPRMWEFAATYLGLAQAGMLDGTAHGLTFGSGQEPLIFAVAPHVERLLVTDLYAMDSTWDIARTESPKDFVLQAAPPGFDASRLEVRSMDMRRVDLPDASFDFCYSISAFEHIGDDPDFLAHLREVRRLLRPGGLYAMTTEVRLATRSSATRGNYCFAVDHLLRLFREAGLHPAGPVDMALSDFAENEPRDLPAMRHHDAAEGLGMTLVVREFGGLMSVPVLFLLRAEPQGAVAVTGLEASIARAEQALAVRTALRGSDWMRLNPWAFFGTQRNPHYDLYAGPEMPPNGEVTVFATGYQAFGDGAVEMQVVLAPSPQDPAPARINVIVMRWEREAQDRLGPCHVQEARVNHPAPGVAATLRFRVAVEAGCRYAVIGHRIGGRGLLSTVDVQVRHAPG